MSENVVIQLLHFTDILAAYRIPGWRAHAKSKVILIPHALYITFSLLSGSF